MDWKTLKEKIYYWDGSWLDIYVQGIEQHDWEKWVDFVNNNYDLNFYNWKTESMNNKIDFPSLKDYWDGNTELMNEAIIKIGTINLKCHFLIDTEIENDFDPGEVKSIDDHKRLISYMADISLVLGKRVIMCPENSPHYAHISVYKGEAKINLN